MAKAEHELTAGTPRPEPVHVPGAEPIESPEQAQPAVSDDEKAEAKAKARAEGSAAEQSKRYVQYVVPRRAADKVKTRPSGAPHPHATVASADSYSAKVGVANAVAEIQPDHWESVGIEASQALRWEFSNNWRVPAARLSDEQLDYLLTNDPRFELVDGRGNKVSS